RGAGAMRVDVIDGAFHGGHRHLHAATGTFTAGGDHVAAVRGGTITDQFRVDFGTAGLGVFVFLDHQHAATTRDDKAIARGIKCTGCLGGSVVVFAGQSTHGVEHHGQGPVF